MQKEYEESRLKVVTLERSYWAHKADFSSMMTSTKQTLRKEKTDINLAHRNQGPFEEQRMELKIERTALLKKLLVFQRLNLNELHIDDQLENLKKENLALKAKLAILIKKDVGGMNFRKMQKFNKKLRKEISELKQMRDKLTSV